MYLMLTFFTFRNLQIVLGSSYGEPVHGKEQAQSVKNAERPQQLPDRWDWEYDLETRIANNRDQGQPNGRGERECNEKGEKQIPANVAIRRFCFVADIGKKPESRCRVKRRKKIKN